MHAPPKKAGTAKRNGTPAGTLRPLEELHRWKVDDVWREKRSRASAARFVEGRTVFGQFDVTVSRWGETDCLLIDYSEGSIDGTKPKGAGGRADLEVRAGMLPGLIAALQQAVREMEKPEGAA